MLDLIMDRAKKVLAKYGLTDKEIDIYLACLNEADLTPFKISQITKIPRTTVYSVLSELALKGLIELNQPEGLEKQQTLVLAKNPSILRKKLWEKRDKLQDLEVDVAEILPALRNNFLKGETDSNFKFLPGVEGAIEAFRDDYDNIDLPLYAFDYLQPMDAIGRKRMNEVVNVDAAKRSAYKTKEYTLLPLSKWTKHVLTYQAERNPDYLENAEWRYVDTPIFDTSVRISIKGDRIKVSCVEEKELYGIFIQSKALAMSLRSMHQVLWQGAKEITKEMIKKWGPNAYLQAERMKKKRKNVEKS